MASLQSRSEDTGFDNLLIGTLLFRISIISLLASSELSHKETETFHWVQIKGASKLLTILEKLSKKRAVPEILWSPA
ncbi:hypothetical protein N7471_010291 [Penicillium samsonianum]|uniref:uncharacterized protein n=1 Tax=Penicillium samsonianum TaxID=1882272 RepID=UPI0025475B03|nr:uncharacterized protein N7471_010291 [Penicillium samsonianum]KAJ6125798.1 hypothetical protein N7471_010291 [Penicillium samsonianum]